MSNCHHLVTIEDRPFQIFVYGRYIQRSERQSLSEMQRRVRHVLNKFGGDVDKAAEYLGVRKHIIHSHIKHIKEKGWL